jgi:hypothetical protein
MLEELQPNLYEDELARRVDFGHTFSYGLETIRRELKALIEKSNVSGPGDMGRLMGIASKHFAGKADNKLVSQLLKQLLG